MTTYKESLELSKECQNKSNELEIKLWKHFDKLRATEAWKDPNYYDGYPELKHFANGTFDHFMKKVFRRTIRWFNSIETILKLKNGPTMLMTYGRCNMVTYLHSTADEQTAIIEAYGKSLITTSFISIKRRLFPDKSIVESINYHKEYLKAKKQLQTANDKIKKLEDDIKILENAIEILSARKAA